MDKNRIITVLSERKGEILQNFKAEISGIFGSVVRGEQTEKSDIDILVDFQEGATLLNLSGLGIYLEDLLGAKVDIVSRRTLRKELEGPILKELVKI